MTIRMFLLARFRKLMFAGTLSWLSCAAAGFSTFAGFIPTWVALIPFAAFICVVLMTLLWIRCPRCNGPLGQNAGFLNVKNRFFQKRVNFCPYCGVSFDTPLSTLPSC